MADFIAIGSSSDSEDHSDEIVAVTVQPQTPKTKIIISVTHGPSVNNAHLREAFSKYKPKKCKVIYTTGSRKGLMMMMISDNQAGYALVQFSKEADALKSIREMDGGCNSFDLFFLTSQ